MAGQGEARSLRQSQHQAPWLPPNPNHGDGVKLGGSLTAWDRECRTLRAKGIAEEELKIYERTIVSANAEVNKRNDAIIERVNRIGACRRQLFLLAGMPGTEDDVRRTRKVIADSKAKIIQLRAEIKGFRGVAEKIPPRFNSPVEV